MNSLKRASFKAAMVILFGSVFLAAYSAIAAEVIPSFSSDVKIKVNFKDHEITNMIETFAKASQKTFIVDPGVRGRVSVFAPEPVSLDEAFDLMSTSLALNGYAIVEREGRYVVMASRNAQRSSIQTLTEIKSVKPERYVTLIITLKHLSAMEVNKYLRVLPSKDGEMTPLMDSNQLLITDYISNVNRIAEMLKTLDQPLAPGMEKIVKESKAREATYAARADARRLVEAKSELISTVPQKPNFEITAEGQKSVKKTK